MFGIIGMIIGIFWIGLKKINGNQYRLFGFMITFDRKPKELLHDFPIKETVMFNKKLELIVAEECDLCHGEDLYINKSIMMCPKCKRNQNRIKSV